MELRNSFHSNKRNENIGRQARGKQSFVCRKVLVRRKALHHIYHRAKSFELNEVRKRELYRCGN